MKKNILISIIAVLLITGCGNKKDTTAPAAEIAGEKTSVVPAAEKKPVISGGADVEIGEKLFIGQVNDVYRNRKDYLGKTIRLEGLFKSGEVGDKTYCYVIRMGPGCCGDDGQVGFEVYWDQPDMTSTAGQKKTYPKMDDWVEAQGELKRYEEDGRYYLYLALSDLNVLEKRGAIFVNQ